MSAGQNNKSPPKKPEGGQGGGGGAFAIEMQPTAALARGTDLFSEAPADQNQNIPRAAPPKQNNELNNSLDGFENKFSDQTKGVPPLQQQQQ